MATREEFKADFYIHRTAERDLQLCAECLLDITHHLIAVSGWQVPDDHASAMRLLGQKGIITTEFAERLVQLIRFRNLIVHVYLQIDLDKVYDNIQNHLDDFSTFA